MDRVRVAIVGCGTISTLAAPGYVEYDKCDVVALCDPFRERAEVRAKRWEISPKIYTEYEDVLNDPEVDAVQLLTPIFLHAPQSIAGLEAGKHVSCMKPTTRTVPEMDKLVAAASRAKTKFRTLENFLFYPPVVKAKELLDSGAIGEPSFVRTRTLKAANVVGGGITMEAGASEWRADRNLTPGGPLFDGGVHKAAVAMWWIGAEPEKVYAMIGSTEEPGGPHGDAVEMPSTVLWKFKDRNCQAVFEYAFADQMPIRSAAYAQDEFFEIIGSKGLIWVTRCGGEFLDMPPVMLIKGTETINYQVPMQEIEGFNRAARDFVDSIIEDKQPMMDAPFSKLALQATLASYEASETDRPVDPSTVT